MKGMGKAIRRYREEAGITQERLAELVDISTNHLGAIEREVKTPTMETFVKLLNVLGAEPNEVLKEVIPLTRMEHTSVVEGKLERLTPKKQESVLRMLDAAGYRLTTSGKSGDSVCGKCTNSSCPDGYDTTVKSCKTSDGYVLETNGVSGGHN